MSKNEFPVLALLIYALWVSRHLLHLTLMFGRALLKQLLQSKLQGVSQAQRDAILVFFEKNPEMVKDMMQKIGNRLARGESQMDAVLAVLREHEHELRTLEHS